MTALSSIDPAEFLHEHLSNASPDLLRSLLATFINTLMSAEATRLRRHLRPDQPRAHQHPQRLPPPRLRHPRRNPRRRDPRAPPGLLHPRLAAGAPPPRRTRPDYRRCDLLPARSLHAADGAARRDPRHHPTVQVQVSVMVAELDQVVEAFCTRPLDQGPYTFLAADALVLKVRQGGRVVNVHALIATAVNSDGHREILGLHVTSSEDGAGWLGFFRDLTARGLTGVRLVTSDAHRGLVDAVGAPPPGAGWRRCRTHYAANLMAATPEVQLAAGAGVAALGLRPTRRRIRARPVRPDPRRAGREAAPRRRAPRRRTRRRAGVHRVPEAGLAPDLVEQPARALEPGDPPPHRRGRDLPRPHRADPPGRSRARRTARRMDRKAGAISASTSWSEPASPPPPIPPPAPSRRCPPATSPLSAPHNYRRSRSRP
jgi:putative transposase